MVRKFKISSVSYTPSTTVNTTIHVYNVSNTAELKSSTLLQMP